MHGNVEYLLYDKIKALGYVQLLDLRYDDRKMVAERHSATVLQFYLT